MTDMKKLSDIVGGHSSAGFILNGNGVTQADKVDNYVVGGAVGGSATLRNVRVGVTTPINNEWYDLRAPKSIEVGLSSSKADWDALSISYTNKLN